MLKIGDSAPLDIKLLNEKKEEVTLRDYLGKYLVIYFYPQDDTPGCSVEACSYRDMNQDIERIGAKVIGVSKDDLNSHKNFKEKYGLNFTLLSDPKQNLVAAFSSGGSSGLLSKLILKSKRMTFILNPKGEIIKVWPNANPSSNAQEAYDFLISYMPH